MNSIYAKAHVPVVEDDADAATIVELALHAQRYKVIVAADGRIRCATCAGDRHA